MLYMINPTGKALHDDKEIYGSLLRCFAPPPRRCPFLLPKNTRNLSVFREHSSPSGNNSKNILRISQKFLPEGLSCSRNTDRVKDKDVWIVSVWCPSVCALLLKKWDFGIIGYRYWCKITKPCSRCSDFKIHIVHNVCFKICTMWLLKKLIWTTQ